MTNELIEYLDKSEELDRLLEQDDALYILNVERTILKKIKKINVIMLPYGSKGVN